MNETKMSDPNEIPQFPAFADDYIPDPDYDFVSDGNILRGVHVHTKTEGDITVIPLGDPRGNPGSPIAYVDVPALFVVPYRVRAVIAGTAEVVIVY